MSKYWHSPRITTPLKLKHRRPRPSHFSPLVCPQPCLSPHLFSPFTCLHTLSLLSLHLSSYSIYSLASLALPPLSLSACPLLSCALSLYLFSLLFSSPLHYVPLLVFHLHPFLLSICASLSVLYLSIHLHLFRFTCSSPFTCNLLPFVYLPSLTSTFHSTYTDASLPISQVSLEAPPSSLHHPVCHSLFINLSHRITPRRIPTPITTVHQYPNLPIQLHLDITLASFKYHHATPLPNPTTSTPTKYYPATSTPTRYYPATSLPFRYRPITPHPVLLPTTFHTSSNQIPLQLLTSKSTYVPQAQPSRNRDKRRMSGKICIYRFFLFQWRSCILKLCV